MLLLQEVHFKEKLCLRGLKKLATQITLKIQGKSMMFNACSLTNQHLYTYEANTKIKKTKA